MDKSWIFCNRLSDEYKQGVLEFIDFAVINSENRMSIRCPCTSCCNMEFFTPAVVAHHLFKKGFLENYIVWDWHGEVAQKSASKDHEIKMSQNQGFRCEDHSNLGDMVNDAFEHCDKNPRSLRDVLEDAEKPLYPGSKYSKLSGLMKLYNVKGHYGWSDSGFSNLLEVLNELLPNGNNLPKSMYEAKKTMKVFGLNYERIHACSNDCILYRKEFANLNECPTCGVSRWKTRNGRSSKCQTKVPKKVLWYFPPIPRFRRLFQSPETARNLTWHDNSRVKDGNLRHPADSPAWQLIDNKWPDFAQEPRNLRLALSSDGINPHSTLSSTYSCWPVSLITYNLPPWLCMKRKFMMLSLLISGPKQPGNDIDVYLAPLIDDLKILWDVGVDAFDAYKKESFQLRAVLMWTISDFPAYGNLSGCTVKGYYGCPVCGINTNAFWLPHSRKMSYMGHCPNEDNSSKRLSGLEVFNLVSGIDTKFGKKVQKKRKRGDGGECEGDDDGECGVDGEGESNETVTRLFKKKSIFFELEYWKHLLIRHQLDVMHIEKNVCESIYGTLLNQPGRTKDGLNARKDLSHPDLSNKVNKVSIKLAYDDQSKALTPAPFTLNKKEKKLFCETLQGVKVPDGYSSNFRNLVSMDECRLHGLKSHDCHTLMQQILPLAIRNCLSKNVRSVITRLCFFFNSLCSKVIRPDSLDQLQQELQVTLSSLEQYFLPAFFDIMVHLTAHLVEEVMLCGPVYLRWMFPFERGMKPIKGYVRNRNRPEGCIAECYIAEEALEFCAEYLSNCESIGLPSGCVIDCTIEKPLGGASIKLVDGPTLAQAHRCVLVNTPEVQPYIE